MRFDRPPQGHALLLAAVSWIVVGCGTGSVEEIAETQQAATHEPASLDVSIADGQYDPPPLYAAIADGEVQRVRDLLAAGEDVNQHDPVYGTPLITALQTRDQELVAVVLEAGADRDGTSRYFLAAETLAEKVADPDLRAVAETFGEQHDLTWRASPTLPALLQANVPAARGQPLVDQHQATLAEQGWFLFRFAHDAQRRQAVLGLLPTADKYVVLAYLGTDGLNYNITTERIIDWLLRLEATDPFVMTEAGLDYLGGRFLSRIRRPGELAERMFAFCPDIVDQGVGTVANLEKELEKPSPALYLWWD